MASISTDATGNRRIQFVAADGKRKAIRLGKMPIKNVQKINTRVEELNCAAVGKHAIDDDTARWVDEIDDVLAGKLAKVGLIKKRAHARVTMLGPFLDEYIKGRAKLKPNTKRNYEVTRDHLTKHFGRGKQLRDITAGDADAWREWLLETKAPSTVSREVKRARQFFKAAARKKFVRENPFTDVKAGKQTNKKREYFLSREDSQKILDECPDAQWRLIFALSRFGGLRCPSEHLALKWSDIDWHNGRMTVTAPKTEHIEGKATRVVPIFAELKPHLEAAWEQAEPGTKYVITRYRQKNCNLRTQLERIIKRAGLQTWPKLFQNLRSTRETELCRDYPLHVACAWIGNSEAVAAKHYLQVTNDDIERATGKAAQKAAHNPAQSAAVLGRNEPKSKNEDDDEIGASLNSYETSQKNTTQYETASCLEAPPRGVEQCRRNEPKTAIYHFQRSRKRSVSKWSQLCR